MALTTLAVQEGEAPARVADPLNSEAAVVGRVADLERRFGDPWDPANELGHAQILAAELRQVPQEAAEALLDAVRLNAEFVPRQQKGGKL